MTTTTTALSTIEYREVPGTDIVVQRSALAWGTFYSAWRPMVGFLPGNFSTFTSFDGREGWYGQMGTERLPEDIEALRGGSPERIAAVRAFSAQRDSVARDAIIAAFPEAMHGRPDGHEIRA